MSFWNFFWGGNATAKNKGTQNTRPGSSPHEDTIHVNIDGAMQISTVWACVTLIVENVASLPLDVYIRTKSGGRKKALTEEIYGILHNQPNYYQTSNEYWEEMLLNRVLSGNGYALKVINGVGDVSGLIPLSSGQMEVELSETKELIYKYQENGVTKPYLQNEIFHIRGMGNGYKGMGVLDYMRASASLSIKSQNHMNRTFNKDARRPGLLYTGGKVLNDAQRAAVKQNFGDITCGKRDGLYLMEGDFRFEALGMTPADIQLLETRKFSVQDLARWFGVPSVLINDTAETTTLGSSVEQIVNGFYKLKLRPMLESIEKALDMRVLTRKQREAGMFCEFNLDALLRSSLNERMEVYSKGVQNGVYLRNECREYENLPSIAGGDIPTAQSNLLPLDKLGQQVNSGGNVPPEPIQQ